MPYMTKEAKRKEKSLIVPCVSQINNAGGEGRSFGMKNLHLIPGGGTQGKSGWSCAAEGFKP